MEITDRKLGKQIGIGLGKIFIKYLEIIVYWHVVVIQSLSHVQLFATPWTVATPGFPVLHHLPEFAQTHVH